jgi:hypothetical protein
MNARTYYPTIVGSCLALFTACALAQAPAATSTETPAASTTGATEQQQAAPSSAPAKAHHAMKQHKAMHARPRNEPTVSSGESEYRTALKRCVEGQGSQRERCLDDAISRYGRS